MVGIHPMTAARLHRWVLLLSAYSYELEFKCTQHNVNVDGLSQLPQGDRHPPAMHSAFVIGQIQALPVTSEQLETETHHDPVLSQVHTFTREEWPADTLEKFKPFRECHEEVTTQGHPMLWGNQVVIPKRLCTITLQELHRNHPDITWMKALA